MSECGSPKTSAARLRVANANAQRSFRALLGTTQASAKMKDVQHIYENGGQQFQTASPMSDAAATPVDARPPAARRQGSGDAGCCGLCIPGPRSRRTSRLGSGAESPTRRASDLELPEVGTPMTTYGTVV